MKKKQVAVLLAVFSLSFPAAAMAEDPSECEQLKGRVQALEAELKDTKALLSEANQELEIENFSQEYRCEVLKSVRFRTPSEKKLKAENLKLVLRPNRQSSIFTGVYPSQGGAQISYFFNVSVEKEVAYFQDRVPGLTEAKYKETRNPDLDRKPLIIAVTQIPDGPGYLDPRYPSRATIQTFSYAQHSYGLPGEIVFTDLTSSTGLGDSITVSCKAVSSR